MEQPHSHKTSHQEASQADPTIARIDLPALSMGVNILFVINILVTLLMLYYGNVIDRTLYRGDQQGWSSGWFESLEQLGLGFDHAGYLLMIVMGILGIKSLVWLYFAVKNLEGLAAPSTLYSGRPLVTIGGIFLPIFNFWHLLTVFQNLRIASFSPDGTITPRQDGLIYLWWGLFLVIALLTPLYLYHLLAWDATLFHSMAHWEHYHQLIFQSNLFGIIYLLFSLLSIYLVNQIDNDQYQVAEAQANRAVVA